ncbi:hypothetical protein ACRCJR_06260 [Aerococcus urinaeequi]|uniref:hypothetical protein n=1 Tax=Aerococcus urinaeequi TaxID=51665 RepID=UPI003D6BCA99
MWLTTGIKVTDTQTGLGVIPRELLSELVQVSGDRFEYETNMLLGTKNKGGQFIPNLFKQYIEENASSHFRIIEDSIAIYGVVFKYIFPLRCNAVRHIHTPFKPIRLISNLYCIHFVPCSVIFI